MATSLKAGFGIAGNPGAETFVKTGAAIGGNEGSTLTKTGAVVATLRASAPDVVIWGETGKATGTLGAEGFGSFGNLFLKTASAVMGPTSPQFTYTKAGIAIGGDIGVVAKSGIAAAVAVASGGKTVSVGGAIYVKAGSGVATFAAFAADTATSAETATANLTGGGGAIENRSSQLILAGSGVAPLAGSAADARTSPESGTGRMVAVANGTDAAMPAESGAGVMAAVASGSKTVSTLAPNVTATGGTAVSAFSAGTIKYVDLERSVTVSSTFTAAGFDGITYGESGAGQVFAVAGGSRQGDHFRTGTGTMTLEAHGINTQPTLLAVLSVIDALTGDDEIVTDNQAVTLTITEK